MTGFSFLSKIGMERESGARKSSGITQKLLSGLEKGEMAEERCAFVCSEEHRIVAICLNRSIFGIAGYFGVRMSRQNIC